MGQAIDRPQHFLFVLWDGGGNVPPQLAVARRMAEFGHRVRILAPRVLRSRIEAAGCTFVPLREVPEHDSSTRADDLLRDWEARSSLSAASKVRDHLIFGSALAYSRDVTEAIEDERPDVVVTDYLLLGVYVAAERAGIPLAALIHTVYPLPAPGMPPYGMGFQPAKGAAGRARDAVIGQVFRRFYNARLGELNHVRAASGLSPLASVFEQFERANRLLILTSQAFDFPATTLPSNVRYVGAQFDDPAWLDPWELPQADTGNLPLVLVSLSTTYQAQADLMRRIIAALADMPVRGIVTLGPALQQANFPLPPNVRLEPYIPHTLVCPHTDLVVTHGGLGTVMTALRFGVPLVVLPMGRDQGDNAARVVWRNAGVQCSSTAGVGTLRHAIRRALGDPQFRKGARQVADGIANEDSASLALKELTSLASSPLATFR